MRKCWLLIAVAAAAFASCVAEQPETPAVDTPEYCRKVFKASFVDDETRTVLSMNDAGTHADVLWEANDKIKVFSVSNTGYIVKDFTTTQGGSSVAEFGCDTWQVGAGQSVIAWYPAERYGLINLDDVGFHFGLEIPTVQKAVKGGVESGVLISTAYSADGDTDELHFQNVLSLIHFKLDGKSASKVRKVKICAGTNISGNCIYYPATKQLLNNAWYTGSGQKYVELSGTFEKGGDYYIALAPVTLESFSMLFYDASGKCITKFSPKTLKLERSRIADFGTVTVDESFGGLSGGVQRYLTHTKGSRPVCIAVLADGFTASQQNEFISRAKEALYYMFDVEPYRTYKEYFNVYLMPVVSNESGASITDGYGNVTTRRDTYFGTRWGKDSYQDMMADYYTVLNYAAAYCPEVASGEISVKELGILMLVNDNRYGGICLNWGDGRYISIIPYAYDGQGMGWRYSDTMAADESSASAGLMTTPDEVFAEVGGAFFGDWRNVVLHEFGGHGFGRFADEYWSASLGAYNSSTIEGHSYADPFSLNVSASYGNVPWQKEVLDELDNLWVLSDLYQQRIGKYQGGNGYPLGVWRSERISCMIDNRPYFSTWQRLLIVKRLMRLAGETFDLEDFYDKDNPLDPYRDLVYSGAPVWKGVPYKPEEDTVPLCPPLPPPVFMD